MKFVSYSQLFEYRAAARRRSNGNPSLKPDDKDAAIEPSNASVPSLYRRFFGVKRDFTEKEVAFFLNIDFIHHVALVAVVDEGGKPTIVGGGRYVTIERGEAEIAFARDRSVSGAGYRYSIEASARHNCARCRTDGTDRRGPA